jgi:hypothetical protein
MIYIPDCRFNTNATRSTHTGQIDDCDFENPPWEEKECNDNTARNVMILRRVDNDAFRNSP